MQNKTFNEIFINRCNDSMDRAVTKGAEYMVGNDRLHNFTAISRLVGDFDSFMQNNQSLVVTSALSALFVASKQIVSLIDLVKKQAASPLYEIHMPLLNEKIGDVHVYIPLIEACLIEENNKRIVIREAKEDKEEMTRE